MLKITPTDSFAKALTLSVVGAFVLSGCGGDKTATPTSGGQNQYEVAGDHVIGNPDAKVTIVEYASVTCGACANWHTTVYPDFKKKYVDSGKVRFVFREFPTSPANLAQAGFLIANCAPEERFFDNIALQFKQQSALLSSPDRRKAYVDLAKASGLNEAEFEACMSNEEELAKYNAVVQAGQDAGVSSTPTFFLNGKKEKMFTIEQFDEAIAPILGEDAPAAEPAAETTE